MKSCFKTFSKSDIGKSKLHKDLVREYGPENADQIYFNIIRSPEEGNSDISFTNWFSRYQDDFGLELTNEPTIVAVKDWLQFIDDYNKTNKVLNTGIYEGEAGELNTIENLHLNEGLAYFTMKALFEDKGLGITQLMEVKGVNVKNVVNTGYSNTLQHMKNSSRG